MMHRMSMLAVAIVIVLAEFPTPLARCQTVDLLERYPTQMMAGDAAPDRARPWGFSNADVFRLSSFNMVISFLFFERRRTSSRCRSLGV